MGEVASAAAFNTLMARIPVKLQEAQEKLNTIFAKAAKFASKMPGFLGGFIEKKIKSLQLKFNALVDKLNGWMMESGDPSRLAEVGDIYSNQIQKKVGEQGPIFAPLKGNSLLVDDKWKGDAADAYRDVLPAQGKAFEGFANAAKVATEALKKAADAIYIFWAGIVGATIALVGGLIAAALASGAPPIALSAVATALATAGVTMATAFFVAQEKMADCASKFQTESNNKTPYGKGGEWPRATRSLLSGNARR